MIRHLLEDALQHLAGLALPGVGRVQRIGSRQQGQRIEQRSLSVVRVAAAHPVNGARVGCKPRSVVELVIVAEEGHGGGDEVGLALGLLGRRAGPSQCRKTGIERILARRRPQLGPLAHGVAPVRHGAIGLALCDREEFLRRLRVPERMQRREGLVERLLRGSGTGDRKIHTLAPAGRFRRRAGGTNACDEQRQHSKSNPVIAHGESLPIEVITRGSRSLLPMALRSKRVSCSACSGIAHIRGSRAII